MTEDVLIKVGMADLNIAACGAVLRTMGLGSCVGLTLYDPLINLGGMAHIMLPSSEIARDGHLNAAKYADTAIPALLKLMTNHGAAASRLAAKLAGGAQMFALASGGDSMRIGPRNVEAVKLALEKFGIPIAAEDTGGRYGRTVELDTGSGVYSIRSVQYGVKEI
ncbi:chemotaxis protein CheD [Cohnella kolymensis]|uniref:Probable chemoreceptor glutamine deamidase CheD n=1 Tax=Cohnella kolymensis TaxID=1590652 RepID=A0ABR5A2L9_9BACL|nr:chemotaxis protein CheD [Cohnella kolymensis]KIL35308.1 chemotaxis protein CheD [Cohnella kolymensis]